MCEFCIQHGEGKKWYLQAKNYNQELLNEQRKARIRSILTQGEENWVKYGVEIDKAMSNDPAATRTWALTNRETPEKGVWAQIVPVEDIERILDISVNIVRLSCQCRRFVRGVRSARFCFGLNVPEPTVQSFRELPDYTHDFEVLTKEAAKKVFRDFDLQGQVHHVRAFPPFIYSICNCNATDCVILKHITQYHISAGIFKAEYVSEVDWEKCGGCRECMKLCNFGAISYSPAVDKCYINKFQCYGCGVCRSVCPYDAISLRDRNAIPAIVNDW